MLKRGTCLSKIIEQRKNISNWVVFWSNAIA
jgi:hypothetical protein